MSPEWFPNFLSSISGSEEFLHLLAGVFFQYGGVISEGLYQHTCHLGSQVNGVLAADNSETGDKPTEAAHFPYQTKKTSAQHSHSGGHPEDSCVADKASTSQSQHDRRDKRHVVAMANNNASSVDEEETRLMEAIRGMRMNLNNNDDDARNGHDDVRGMQEIAGLESVKEALEEFACFFLHFPHLTRQLRQRSTTGILLFGPQGTGKTLLARNFARQYNLALYDIRASAVLSKYVGEAEKFVRALFRQVRSDTPAVLLLDECDGLLARGDGHGGGQQHHLQLLQNELKNQWSDLIYSRDEVLIVGATNKPFDIDMDGFGRRLSLKLHVDLPDGQACLQLLRRALGEVRHVVGDVVNGEGWANEAGGPEMEMETLAHLCHERQLTGYDICCLVEGQLRRALRSITRSQYFRISSWHGHPTLVPCSRDDAGSQPGSWKSLAAASSPYDPELSYVPLTFADVYAAINAAQPTVDAAMRQKHHAFAAQYGVQQPMMI